MYTVLSWRNTFFFMRDLRLSQGWHWSSLYLACTENLLFLQGDDKRLPRPAEGESTHPVHGVRAGLCLYHFPYELFPAVLYPTHFNPENGDSIFFWSAGVYMKVCTVSQPRIWQSELSLLKLHNLYIFSVFRIFYVPFVQPPPHCLSPFFLFPNSKCLSRIFFIKLLHVYFNVSIKQLQFRAVLTQANMDNFCNTGRFPFTPTFILGGLVVF
jgi:hypothetical protein